MSIDPRFHITAEELAVVFEAKLAGVTIANGFQTDIGLRVFRGRRQINDSLIPCVVIVEGDDRPIDEDEKFHGITRQVNLNQHYVFEAYDFGDPDHPNDKGHSLVRDLKRAIFAKDEELKKKIRYLRYGGRNIGVREEGTTVVAAFIDVDASFLEDLSEA